MIHLVYSLIMMFVFFPTSYFTLLKFLSNSLFFLNIIHLRHIFAFSVVFFENKLNQFQSYLDTTEDAKLTDLHKNL